MMLFTKMFYESYPDNPETVVISNRFYPYGLTEKDIYRYYIANKNIILKYTDNREVMLFLAPKTNEFVVKRKINNSFIKLNNSNYEKIITGRTVSIHSTMNRREKFGIIDVDYHSVQVSKECTRDIYHYLNKNIDFIKSLKIFYTGKDAFHIHCMFDKYYNIDKIRKLLFDSLIKSDYLKTNYTIGKTRNPEKPNLDLSSNKYRGGFITPYSLSTYGLRCIDVDISELMSFTKGMARIKVRMRI